MLLVVECMGATTVLVYGLHLLYNPVMEDFPEDPNCPGKPLVRPPITLRAEMSFVYKRRFQIGAC